MLVSTQYRETSSTVPEFPAVVCFGTDPGAMLLGRSPEIRSVRTFADRRGEKMGVTGVVIKCNAVCSNDDTEEAALGKHLSDSLESLMWTPEVGQRQAGT